MLRISKITIHGTEFIAPNAHFDNFKISIQ